MFNVRKVLMSFIYTQATFDNSEFLMSRNEIPDISERINSTCLYNKMAF